MKLISILSFGGWLFFPTLPKMNILFGFSLPFKEKPFLKRAALWEAVS